MKLVRESFRAFSSSHIFLIASIFSILISLISCMKRNIYSSLGVGGGIPPGSGISKLKISPGEFDEDIQGVFEVQGFYRFEKKDIVPATGYALLYNFREINDKLFPYFGAAINVLWFRAEKNKISANGEFSIVLGIESVLSKNISLFYEFPINIIAQEVPKYNLIFGLSFYFKRF